MRWFGTLKARLMIASALVIAASVAGTAMVVLERVQKRSEQAVMDLELDNAERMASLLVQRVVALQKMLRATAERMPQAARHEVPAAVAYLESNPALAVNFATVYVARPDGATLALHDGVRAGPSTVTVGDRDYFQRTVSGNLPVVSPPLPGRVSREPVINFTMPVAARDGPVESIIGGTLRLASRNLFDDLTYAGHGAEGHIIAIVADASGTIISHPQRERVMRSIESEPGLADAVARWVAQGRPIEPTGFAVHEAGYFISMAGVPGADWMVFRLAPDTQLLGGLAQARRETLLWAGAVALGGSLIILGLLARLLGPLTRLRERALALHDSAHPLDDGWPVVGGEIGELSSVLQDVLRERAAGEHAKQVLVQQMGSVLAAAPIGIAITRERRFVLAGNEFGALLGFGSDELIGREARVIFAADADYEALGAQVGAAFAAGRPYFGELQFRRRDGSNFWGRLQGRPVDHGDADAGTIWLLEDVTEHREARERLSWSASHDALTRLLNRGAFEERLHAWLVPQPALPASLLFIDLDHFKRVNDTAGHAAGDVVLRQVAAVLHTHARGSDAVGRLGGDEFALLLPGCVAAVALQLGETLQHSIAQIAVEHGGHSLRVGASIGVVEIDAGEGLGAAAWLARADAGCYQAKHAGRGTVRLAPLAGEAR
jgi:diguanylate cyclase (GGDEF)-like protein/PAS domain S-box-containing protein